MQPRTRQQPVQPAFPRRVARQAVFFTIMMLLVVHPPSAHAAAAGAPQASRATSTYGCPAGELSGAASTNPNSNRILVLLEGLNTDSSGRDALLAAWRPQLERVAGLYRARRLF